MELKTQDQENKKKITVVIAEDNEKNRKLFRLIISSMGYETLTAGNGEEAVALAKEKMPDLILMDIQMPVMDGLSAMTMLKSDEATKDIPVIALTSYAMKGDRERFLEHGFFDYIAKPVSKNALMDAVKKVLEKDVE